MFYLLVSFVLLFLIYSIESKKSKVSKLKDISYFKDSVRNDFNLVKILFTSLLFISLVMLIMIEMEQGGFISFQKEIFKIKYLPYIIYSILVVPVFEEYFYRFLPYSFGKYNIFAYILLVFFSSLIFTYFHSLDSFTSIFVFVMAIVFSVMFLKTKNISYPIFSHSLYNLITNLRVYVKFDSAFMYFIVFVLSLFVLIFYNKRSKRRIVNG